MLIWFLLRPLANQPSLREAEIDGQVTMHRDIYEYQLFDLFKSSVKGGIDSHSHRRQFCDASAKIWRTVLETNLDEGKT